MYPALPCNIPAMPICPDCNVAYFFDEEHQCRKQGIRVRSVLGNVCLFSGFAAVITGEIKKQHPPPGAWVYVTPFLLIAVGLLLIGTGTLLLAMSRRPGR